jgi:hypothetical protein
MSGDNWLQQQTRMRQRRKDKNLPYTSGAPFLGIITGAHDPDTEQVNMAYHGGERKVPTLHPYVGPDSWIRVGSESGVPVVAATRPDSNDPELLAYATQQPEDRIRAFKARSGVYRPVGQGEIEIHSRGLAQSYYSRRPILEQRAGLIRTWLDQDELENGAKAPLHVRTLHLHKHGTLGDEERFGVVQRWLPGSKVRRTFVHAARTPDPVLTALVNVEAALAGVIPIPGPWAKEYTRIIKSGAAFPPILVDVREGDVIDDLGMPMLSSISGLPLRYKAQYYADSPSGGAFFIGVDQMGNFNIAAPTEATIGGDITIPMGDFAVKVGRNYSSTTQVNYDVATATGTMTFNSALDLLLQSTSGNVVIKPSQQLQIGGADQQAVLGNVLKSFLVSLLDIFIKHRHVGNMGSPTPLDPAIVAEATQLKASPISDGMILSEYVKLSKLPV